MLGKALVVCYSKMKGFGGGVFAARSTVNALAKVCDIGDGPYGRHDRRSFYRRRPA